MEFVMTILEGAWRYVTTIRIADYLLDCCFAAKGMNERSLLRCRRM